MKVYELYNDSARLHHVFGVAIIPGRTGLVTDPTGILEASIRGEKELKIVDIRDDDVTDVEPKNPRTGDEKTDGQSGTNAAIPGDSKGADDVGTAGMGSQGATDTATSAAGTDTLTASKGSNWVSPKKAGK